MQLSERVGGFQEGSDTVYAVGGDCEPCRMDMVMAPGLSLNTPHAHPRQKESFHVLSGTLDIEVGGKLHELRAGDEIVIDPGAMHRLGNRHDVPALVYKEVLPGLDVMQFYRALRALEEKNLGALTNTIEFAVLARRFDHLFRLPPFLSTYASTLAAIGRIKSRITG
jgi:hypothetical protein